MKPFTTLAFAILVLAGLAHVLRLATGFDMVIDGHAIPRWASVIGAIVALGVAYKLREEAKG